MIFSILIALIAAFAAAAPENPTHQNYGKQKTASAVQQKPAATKTSSTVSICSASDTSSTQAVEKVLDSTGAMAWLDIMLSELPNGEKDWLNVLWKETFPDHGESPLQYCGTIGGECPIETDCQKYNPPIAYWVFYSVLTLHNKINSIHAELFWDGWLDGLSIDQIVKDFSVISPDYTWAKWIAGAFSMAAGFATGADLNKPLRGMMGMAGAGFAEVASAPSSHNNVDKTSVENTLRNLIGGAGNYVASILANATGHGNAETLPIYTLSTLQYGTSRFFQDNTILLDENNDNSSFITSYKGFTQNVVCYCRSLLPIMKYSIFNISIGEEAG